MNVKKDLQMFTKKKLSFYLKELFTSVDKKKTNNMIDR